MCWLWMIGAGMIGATVGALTLGLMTMAVEPIIPPRIYPRGSGSDPPAPGDR